MKIICLIENSTDNNACLFEHGLSLYIEASGHKLLMDSGASDAFLSNAEILGVDLNRVESVFLSHGHYDHGGGLPFLTERFPTVKLYMKRSALAPHFSVSSEEQRFNGIDNSISEYKNIIFTDDFNKIDDDIFIFSNVKSEKYPARGNKNMKILKENEYFQDDFSHEQYIVLKENEKSVLLSGCAHNGIINILDKYSELFSSLPDVVISGFHLMNKHGYTDDDISNIKSIAAELKKTGCLFYTGHCTGEKPFEIMKQIMGDRLLPIHTGNTINI